MRLILNIGMHKTGSSSIQRTFHRYTSDHAAYLDMGHPNQSAVFMTLFMETPETYSGHVRNQRPLDEVMQRREKYGARAEIFIRENDGKDIIASGEDIVLLTLSELRDMKAYFDQFFSEVLIVGYVRPPVSLMNSAIQQRIAGGVSLRPADIYPGYRDRLEKFDMVFGRENVVLTKFHRDTLNGGDVVVDFAGKAGIDAGQLDIKRENQSRSLEGSAVLFAQRKFGRGFGCYPDAPKDNRYVSEALREIGATPIRLHSDFVMPILSEHEDDLNWITQRLGVDFVDQPSDDPDAIRSAGDLLKVARNHMPEILELLLEESRKTRTTDPKLVASAVDLLIEMVRARRETRRGK